MRDVFSNETLKEINDLIDEIIENLDNNVRDIVGAGNYELPTLFSYTNYSGQTINVHGSTFRHEIIIDNADGNNLIGDICTVIGDRSGIKLAKAGVEDRHDTFANYWDSTIDIAYSLDNINGYVFDMHNGYIGEGANSSSNMSFKIDGLEIGKSYTLTFTGRFARAEFVVAGDSYARICSDIHATPYIASVTLEKDTVGHVYRLDFTNNTQSTTLYLNFDFLSLSYEESSYVSEFIAENLVIAGMNIGIISRYMYYNRKWYLIEAGGGGAGGASALSDLTDTNISNPTDGQVLKYNNGFWENDDESGGTTVVANPQGTASAELEKLQVGNNIYNIPQGTEVVANPAGTASTQLNKLQVGNDIYSIPSGGGGGSYSETTLYTNSGTSRENIALSDSYSNYNQIYFECIRVADNRGYVVPYYMPISSLSTGHFQFFGYNEYISFDVTNATTFTLVNGDGSWYVKRVIGIKY